MNENIKFGVYTRNGNEIDFNFKTSLNAKSKIKFVNSVTETLVDANYNYIIKDMVFDFFIINIFTDVDTSFVKDRNCLDPIGMMEDLIEETNIVDIVNANADTGLIEELRRAVDYNIEYRTGIHRNVIAESLSSLIDTAEKKLSEIDANSMMEMYQMLSGVSGELTADKILDAYSKSDMYKNQYRQMLSDQADSSSAEVVKGKKNKKKSATSVKLSSAHEVL